MLAHPSIPPPLVLSPPTPQYKAMYQRSIEDPDGFWADIAQEFHWDKKARALSDRRKPRRALIIACTPRPE